MTERASQLPKILFVDDEPNILEALRRTMHPMRQSWDMEFLQSAEDAIPVLARHASALVVSDWTMSGMDGFAFCRLIRDEEEKNENVSRYVIVLTGRQDSESLIRALENGADDYITKPFESRELIARINVGLRIILLQQRLRDANQQLVKLATTDPLTGALNRRQGTEILAGELDRVMREKQDLSAVLIDLDKFKQVNDTYGHAGGDAALCAVVERLKTLCRRYDSVVRWGGDELMLICPHAGPDQAVEIAERLRAAVESMSIQRPDGRSFSVTLSLGATCVPSGCRAHIGELLAQADEALYDAKEKGRNRVGFACWPVSTQKKS